MKNKNEHIQLYYVNEGKTGADGKFVKTPGTHPVATIALVWLMDETDPFVSVPHCVARGVAICGKTEQFSRGEGRKWAIKRARQALYRDTSSWSLDEGGTTDHFWDCLHEQFGDHGEITMRSENDVYLTANEKRLLDIYMEKLVTPKSTDSVKVSKPVKIVNAVKAIKSAAKGKSVKKASVKVKEVV